MIFRTALLELCTSNQFLHYLELFTCDCLNYVLAHLSNFSQFADVMLSIVTKQSQANVAFTHLHFELSYFVCVYTSFMFGFYQSCAVVFGESAFFIMAQFQELAVSPGNLSETSSIVFVALIFALFGFFIFGIFGFAMQCVLCIYIILDLYLFLVSPFCCSVFWGTVA